MFEVYKSFLSKSSRDNVLSRESISYEDIPFNERNITEVINPSIIRKDAIGSCECVHYSWNGGKADIKLYLLHGEGIKLPPLKQILFKLSAFLHLVHCGEEPIQMSIVLTGFTTKRYLPSVDGSALNPYHVNGGSTFTLFDKSKIIIVYRYEDLFKVLLHELFHFYGYDAFLMKDERVIAHEMQIAKAFNVKTTQGLHLHEAYNDFLTCVYSTGFHILFENPTTTKRDFARMFKADLLKVEQYITETAMRILRHFNGKEFIETTPAFSYYILKAVLFAKRDRVIERKDDVLHVLSILSIDEIRKTINATTKSRKKSLRMFPYNV
jgi:hypothetical protein